MHRFFLKQPIQDTVFMTGPDVDHIRKVLRLRSGDEITVLDGKGLESSAVIEEVTRDSVRIRCGRPEACKTEPSVKVTLFQGLPKSGKMETVIQKCVELGVTEIVPMLTDRCVTQPKDSFSSRIERWQRVSEEAAKQSRRGIVPAIGTLCPASSFPADRFDLILMAYEDERTRTLKSALKDFRGEKVALLIGPEGGFSPVEVECFARLGAVTFSLGPRILRTETAGMAATAQILYEVDQ